MSPHYLNLTFTSMTTPVMPPGPEPGFQALNYISYPTVVQQNDNFSLEVSHNRGCREVRLYNGGIIKAVQHNTADGKLDKIDAVWVKAATATIETNTERRDSTRPGQNLWIKCILSASFHQLNTHFPIYTSNTATF